MKFKPLRQQKPSKYIRYLFIIRQSKYSYKIIWPQLYSLSLHEDLLKIDFFIYVLQYRTRSFHTYLGTSVSVLVMVVGSSSQSVAMSCPWGTDTRQYTGDAPRNLFLVGSSVGSVSICSKQKTNHSTYKMKALWKLWQYVSVLPALLSLSTVTSVFVQGKWLVQGLV